MYLEPGKVTLEQALHAAEGDSWYGQSLLREVAKVLAKEVRRYQDTVNPLCDFRYEDQCCILEADHKGMHKFE